MDDRRCSTPRCPGAAVVLFVLSACSLPAGGPQGDRPRCWGSCDGAGNAEPDCPAFESPDEEVSPVQIAGLGAPEGSTAVSWQRPVGDWTDLAPFAGVPGEPAGHEGEDYVHDAPDVTSVPVRAAAEGLVVYVRTGCGESCVFCSNEEARECGAGWGNHVVVSHDAGMLTRYAHLAPGSISVSVGEVVARGQQLGDMGNTGRSDVRHLHFELGVGHLDGGPFDPCGPSQSFEAVYDPELLAYEPPL